jgi:lipopolysaccharide transport system permease protein
MTEQTARGVRDPEVTPIGFAPNRESAGTPLPAEGRAVERDILETEIMPQTGWPSLELGKLWRYRDLILQLTLRNVKVRYKQTALGVIWAVLQPVLWMLVFWWGLTRWVPGAGGDVPYPIFVFSGLLPWLFFQSGVTQAAGSVVASEALVTKVYFPRLAIPVAALAAALVDLVISFVILIGLMLFYRVSPSINLLLLPFAIALLIAASTGIGTLLAALTVSYRDFRHAVAFLLQVWMIATPTIYLNLQSPAVERSLAQVAPAAPAVETVPRSDQTAAAPATYNRAGWLSILNPMTVPIDFFRATVLGSPISWSWVVLSALVNLALCLIGIGYYRHVEDSFADVI